MTQQYEENDLPEMPDDTPEHDSSSYLEDDEVDTEQHLDDDPEAGGSSGVTMSASEAAPKKNSGKMLLMGASLAGVLGLGGVGYFLFGPSGQPPVAAAPAPAAEATDPLDAPAGGDELAGLPGATEAPAAAPAMDETAAGLDPTALPADPAAASPVASAPASLPAAAPATAAPPTAPAPVAAAPAAAARPVAAAPIPKPAPVAPVAAPAADSAQVTELKDRVASLEAQVAELSAKLEKQRAAVRAVAAAPKAPKKKEEVVQKAPAAREALPGYVVREITSNGKNAVVRTPSGRTVLLSKDERVKINGKTMKVTAIDAKASQVLIDDRYVISAAEAAAAPKPASVAAVTAPPVVAAPAAETVVAEPKAPAAAGLKEATGWRVNAVFQGQQGGKPFLVQRPDNTFMRVGLGDTLPGLGVVRDAAKDGRLTVGSYVIYPER